MKELSESGELEMTLKNVSNSKQEPKKELSLEDRFILILWMLF